MTTTIDLEYDLHNIAELDLNDFEMAMIEQPLDVELTISYKLHPPHPLDVLPETSADTFKIEAYKLSEQHSEKVSDMLDDVICNNEQEICNDLFDAHADRFLDK